MQPETLLRKNTPLAISPKLQSLSTTFGPTINQTSETKREEPSKVSQLPDSSDLKEPIIHEEIPIKKANSVSEDDESSFVLISSSSFSDILYRGSSNESILEEYDIPSSNGSSARTSLSDTSFQSIPKSSRIKDRAKVLNEQYEKIQQKEMPKHPDDSNMSTTRRKTQPILRETAKKIAEEQTTQENLLDKTRTLKERHKVLKDYIENYEKELKILEEKYKRKSSDAQNTNIVKELRKQIEARTSTANEQQIQHTSLAISSKIQSLSTTFGPTINQTSENKKQEEKQNEVSQLPYRSSSSEPVIQEETPIKKANSVIEDDASSFVSNLRSSSSDIQTLEQKKSSPRGRSNESILEEDDISLSNNSSTRTSFTNDSISESINPQISSQETHPTTSVLERVKRFEAANISTANEQHIQQETPLKEALNVLSQRDYNFAQLKEQNERKISEQQARQKTPIETGNELEKEIDDENFKPILTIPKGIKFTYVKRSSDNEIAKQQEIPKPLENKIQQKGSNIERLKKTFENCNSDKPKTTLVKSQAKLRETARKVLENSDSLLAQENRLPTMDELLNIFEKEAKKQPEPKSMTRSESPQKPNVILKPIREKIEKNKAQKDALEKLKKLKSRCNELKEPIENFEKKVICIKEKHDQKNLNKQKMQKETLLQEKETAQSKLEKIENCQTTYEKLKAKSEKLGQTLEELKKQSQQKSLKEQENQGRLSNGTSKKLSPEMERLKNFFDSCSKPKAIQIQYKDLTNNE